MNWKNKETYEKRIKELETENKELNDQLRLHSVSNSIAYEYAGFCVMCYRIVPNS